MGQTDFTEKPSIIVNPLKMCTIVIVIGSVPLMCGTESGQILCPLVITRSYLSVVANMSDSTVTALHWSWITIALVEGLLVICTFSAFYS